MAEKSCASDCDNGLARFCNNSQDLIEFFEPMDFWLKPISSINITVQLPQLSIAGQCISTWEVIEKLKKKARPDVFRSLKVIKSTVEFIRFQGDLESKKAMESCVGRLKTTQLKLSGFIESLKVKAARVKIGSTRYEWESYFRDNPSMNEMKPGYRPDTIHVANLPMKWFGGTKPSSNQVVRVFGQFGDIRRFHIPCLDEELDLSLKVGESSVTGGGFKRFNYQESLSFDAYIMYKDYISFVRAMDALRGMKLVKRLNEIDKERDRYLEYDIRIEFDKTKHLSDKAIKRRRLARDFGIKNQKEMRTLKEEARNQRKLYEDRVKLLRQRKDKAKGLLSNLMASLSEKEIDRRKEEEKKTNELKLRERLLYEEKKLRERLLERRREHLRQQSKEKGGLKSVASAPTAASCSQSVGSTSLTSASSFVPRSINHPNHRHRNNNNNHFHPYYHQLHHDKARTLLPNVNSTITTVTKDETVTTSYQSEESIDRVANLKNDDEQKSSFTNNALYKNHRPSCKHYKFKSLVTVARKDENK